MRQQLNVVDVVEHVLLSGLLSVGELLQYRLVSTTFDAAVRSFVAHQCFTSPKACDGVGDAQRTSTAVYEAFFTESPADKVAKQLHRLDTVARRDTVTTLTTSLSAVTPYFPAVRSLTILKDDWSWGERPKPTDKELLLWSAAAESILKRYLPQVRCIRVEHIFAVAFLIRHVDDARCMTYENLKEIHLRASDREHNLLLVGVTADTPVGTPSKGSDIDGPISLLSWKRTVQNPSFAVVTSNLGRAVARGVVPSLSHIGFALDTHSSHTSLLAVGDVQAAFRTISKLEFSGNEHDLVPDVDAILGMPCLISLKLSRCTIQTGRDLNLPPVSLHPRLESLALNHVACTSEAARDVLIALAAAAQVTELSICNVFWNLTYASNHYDAATEPDFACLQTVNLVNARSLEIKSSAGTSVSRWLTTAISEGRLDGLVSVVVELTVPHALGVWLNLAIPQLPRAVKAVVSLRQAWQTAHEAAPPENFCSAPLLHLKELYVTCDKAIDVSLPLVRYDALQSLHISGCSETAPLRVTHPVTTMRVINVHLSKVRVSLSVLRALSEYNSDLRSLTLSDVTVDHAEDESNSLAASSAQRLETVDLNLEDPQALCTGSRVLLQADGRSSLTSITFVECDSVDINFSSLVAQQPSLSFLGLTSLVLNNCQEKHLGDFFRRMGAVAPALRDLTVCGPRRDSHLAVVFGPVLIDDDTLAWFATLRRLTLENYSLRTSFALSPRPPVQTNLTSLRVAVDLEIDQTELYSLVLLLGFCRRSLNSINITFDVDSHVWITKLAEALSRIQRSGFFPSMASVTFALSDPCTKVATADMSRLRALFPTSASMHFPTNPRYFDRSDDGSDGDSDSYGSWDYDDYCSGNAGSEAYYDSDYYE